MLYSQNVAPKAAPGRSLRAQQAPRATFHGRGAAPSLGSRQQSYRLPVSMMSDPRTESGREASSAPIAAPYSPQLPQMPPPPPRVQHSSAFLLRDVRSSSSSAAEAASAQPPPVSSSSENLGVVEWALRRHARDAISLAESRTALPTGADRGANRLSNPSLAQGGRGADGDREEPNADSSRCMATGEGG